MTYTGPQQIQAPMFIDVRELGQETQPSICSAGGIIRLQTLDECKRAYGPDPDDTTVRRFQVRLSDGPVPKKNQALDLIDHKIERMWEYQVYDSLRSPIEKRSLSLKWLRDHGIEVSESELSRIQAKKEQTESPAEMPTVSVLRDTLVDAA